MNRTIDVDCTVDVAHLPEALFAHVTLDGVHAEPGDTVQVHDAPADVRTGERLVCARRATVVRAHWWARWWTRLRACVPVADLFEVGFSDTRPSMPGRKP